MAVILDQQDIDVFIGLDVGKSGHHAVALNREGKRLFDKALPNDEARLREILSGLVWTRKNPARRGSAGHHRDTARCGGSGCRRSGRPWSAPLTARPRSATNGPRTASQR